MKSNLKELAVKYYESTVFIVTSIAFLLVFIAGAGRYRTIFFYSVFSALKAIFSFLKIELKILYFFFLPVLFVVLYLDIEYGQIYPIFPNLHFLVTILVLVIVELSVREYANKILQRISDGEIFTICPNCKYENEKMVRECVNCSYKSGATNILAQENSVSAPIMDRDIIVEIEIYRKSGLYKPLPRKVRNILNLDNEEIILINNKRGPFKTFYKNGVNLLAKNILLTTKKIIFVHYYFFSSGWRMKEIVPYDDIKEMQITMKHQYATKEPVIAIATENDIYELFFTHFIPYKEKIAGIVDCIKKRSPNIKVVNDLH